MTDSPTPQQRMEAEQTAIAALTDTTEQALATSAFRWKLAAMKGEKGATSELARATKELNAYREQQSSSGDRFRNIAEAARWIVSQGYLVSERSISNHSRYPGFPHKQKDGSYIKDQVADYAATAWENPTRQTQPGQDQDREDYKTGINRETERKLKLKNDQEEGRLIARSLVEQELSARLSFLKRDLYNLGPRAIDTLVEKFCILVKDQGVELDGVNLHSLISDMEQVWDKNISAYLDSYARPRGFLPTAPAGEIEQ
jgi:hypothetical protein